MLQQKPRIMRTATAVLFVLLFSVGAFIFLFMNRPFGVGELWEREYKNRNLEGKTMIIRGDVLFDPQSGFHYYDVYILDTKTPNEARTHDYAIWFGVGLADISCFVDNEQKIATCQPFDPTAASKFEFKGTIHVAQIGKKEIMWLSDIDFENSCHFVDGKWLPIPLGKFVIPFENK